MQRNGPALDRLNQTNIIVMALKTTPPVTTLSVDFPFRDVMPINMNWQIICWHDEKFLNSRYDLAQRLYRDKHTDPDQWVVCASFRYAEEFFVYLSTKQLDGY